MQPDEITEGDIIELTLSGSRRTAEVMLIGGDDMVLLDFFDGERPVMAPLSKLEDVAVFHPDVTAA